MLNPTLYSTLPSNATAADTIDENPSAVWRQTTKMRKLCVFLSVSLNLIYIDALCVGFWPVFLLPFACPVLCLHACPICYRTAFDWLDSDWACWTLHATGAPVCVPIVLRFEQQTFLMNKRCPFSSRFQQFTVTSTSHCLMWIDAQPYLLQHWKATADEDGSDNLRLLDHPLAGEPDQIITKQESE